MKKKIFLLAIPLTIIILLTACDLANTPTSKVEELFTKYQKIDDDIASGIDSVLEEQNLTESRKERYRKILQNQYQNLSYQIKDETIDGNIATVTVEIEVLDLKKSVDDLIYNSEIYDTKDEYDEERLNRLEKAKEKVKYTLELTVTKNYKNNWKLDALTNEDIKKIQGMY